MKRSMRSAIYAFIILFSCAIASFVIVGHVRTALHTFRSSCARFLASSNPFLVETSSDGTRYEVVDSAGFRCPIAAMNNSSAPLDISRMVHKKIVINAYAITGPDVIIQQCPPSGRIVGKKWCKKMNGEAIVIDTLRVVE